jgi:hypothetical protein
MEGCIFQTILIHLFAEESAKKWEQELGLSCGVALQTVLREAGGIFVESLFSIKKF